MRTLIERRMNKLEQAAHSDEDRLDLIIISGMSTGGSKSVRATFGDKVVDRRADEAEDEFIERATAATLAATDLRPCLLFLSSEEVSQ